MVQNFRGINDTTKDSWFTEYIRDPDTATKLGPQDPEAEISDPDYYLKGNPESAFFYAGIIKFILSANFNISLIRCRKQKMEWPLSLVKNGRVLTR